MWLAWGLAFLTKGPPALLPLLAIAAFRRFAPRRVRLLDPVGLVLFAATASSWYAWVAARHAGLLAYFVGDEVIGRALSNEFGRNPQWYKPFVIYLPVLVLGQGVWLLAGARLVAREGLSSPRAIWARVRRGEAGSFLLLWLVLPLAVLWVSSSRLPLYVLPLYAPIALAIARGLTLSRGADAARHALSVAVPSAVVIVLLKAVSAYGAPPSDKDMGQLYALARREAGAQAEYRTFTDDRLYGLQFYAGGALRRVSRAGDEPWADERLDEALGAMGRQRDATHVVVSSARGAPELEAALAAAGLSFRRVPAPSRELFVVTAQRAALAREGEEAP